MCRVRKIAKFVGPGEKKIKFLEGPRRFREQLGAEVSLRRKQRQTNSPAADIGRRQELRLADLSDWRGPRPPADRRPRGDWVTPPGRAVS